MTGVLVDHPFTVMVVVAAIAVVVAVVLHRILHEKLATLGVSILLSVLVAIPMTHLFALSRDRDQRRIALRTAHLERLRPTLRADSEKLHGVVEHILAQGRFTDVSRDTAANETELKKQFYPDPLSPDLANHFPAYSAQKERLRTDVEEQDREDREAQSLVMTALHLPPSHVYRLDLARTLLWKCRGIAGGGMTLRAEPGGGYSYSWLGGSSGSSAGPPPREIVEAFGAYNSFRPTAEVSAHCESLKARAARILESARKLSLEARGLAERPTLTGECEYTKLE